MSERGSFVTSYIYCRNCLEAAAEVLIKTEKYMCSVLIPSWEKGKNLPIIAGKLGGLYSGEELHAMEEYIERLRPKLCHVLQISVIPDTAVPKVFTVVPEFRQPVDSISTTAAPSPVST